MCSGFLCHVLSDQSEYTALLMAFNLWISPGFIFEFDVCMSVHCSISVEKKTN